MKRCARGRAGVRISSVADVRGCVAHPSRDDRRAPRATTAVVYSCVLPSMSSTESLATLAAAVSAPPQVRHPALLRWVAQIAALTQPTQIAWCDGTQDEYDRLCAQMVAAGTLRRLDPARRPNSYLAWSDPCL